MFRKDFIYTLFCGNIPDEQRVYRVNPSINDDNIKNLAVQYEFQPHPLFDLLEANDRGIIRNKQAINVVGSLQNSGYLHIVVSGIKTDRVNYLSHHFICETFNGSILNDLVFDHINSIKSDNHIEHLDLVAPKENSRR